MWRKCFQWIRANLLLFIFLAIVLLQYFQWEELRQIRRHVGYSPDPPQCSERSPCVVELDDSAIGKLANEIGSSVAYALRR